jgi:hypothetical protein
MIEQPVAETNHLARAGHICAGTTGVGIHHDGKPMGIQTMSFEERGRFSGASPDGDAQARAMPRAKFSGDALSDVVGAVYDH